MAAENNKLTKYGEWLGSAEGTAFIQNAQKLVSVDRKTELSEKKPGAGFSYLSIGLASTDAVLPKENLKPFLLLQLKRRGLPEALQKQIDGTWESLVLTYDCDEVFFDIKWHNHVGEIQYLRIAFGRIAGKPDELFFKSLLLHGMFQLAPDYFVVTKSKSNFFGSKSSQSIKYVNRELTLGDVKDVFGCLLQAHASSLEFFASADQKALQ